MKNREATEDYTLDQYLEDGPWGWVTVFVLSAIGSTISDKVGVSTIFAVITGLSMLGMVWSWLRRRRRFQEELRAVDSRQLGKE